MTADFLRNVFRQCRETYQRCEHNRGYVGLVHGRKHPGIEWTASFSDFIVDFEMAVSSVLSREGRRCYTIDSLERRLGLALLARGLYPPRKYFNCGQFIEQNQLGQTAKKPRLKDYDRRCT